MESVIKWLQVAGDEIETLQTYYGLLEGPLKEETLLHEIIGDEFNHAMIALFTAASESGIKIPTDGVNEAITGVNFKVEEIPEEGQTEAGRGKIRSVEEDESDKQD